MDKPDFTLIWGSTRPGGIPAEQISNTDYSTGWQFRGGVPPLTINFDYYQNLNDTRVLWLGEQLPVGGTTSFIKTLLDDVNSAAARATLEIVDASTSVKGLVQLANALGASTSLAATQALVTSLGATMSGTAASWTASLGKFKINGGIVTCVAHGAVTATLRSAYTSTHIFFLATWHYDTPGNTDSRGPIKGGVVNLASGHIMNSDGASGSGVAIAQYISFGMDS